MRHLRVLLWRLRGLVDRRRLDADLDAEIESLLDLHADAHERGGGLTRDAARDAARRELAGIEAMKEAYRDRRGLPAIDALLQDLRVGLRSLRSGGRLTAAAALSLALGIGANAALFSVFDAVVLKALPYREPDRLVWITEDNREFQSLSAADFDVWRSASRSFTTLAAASSQDVTLAGDPAIRVRALGLTAPVGAVFGTAPSRGRDFAPDDFATLPALPFTSSIDDARAAPAALITDGLLQRRFGGDTGVIGRTVLLGRTPYRVIGVLPSDFVLPVGPLVRFGIGIRTNPDVVVAMHAGAARAAIGRLRDTATVDMAWAELQTLRTIANQSRDARTRTTAMTLNVRGIADRITAGTTGPIVLLWGACAFVLLVTCVNVANILLTRSLARRREFAVRLSLGAGRARLVRQLLTETFVLAAIGSAGGLALAWLLVRLLARQADVDVPRLAGAAIDWRVLLFAAAICAVVTVAAGILPSAVSAGIAPAGALGDESRTASPARRRTRLQSALTAAQIAVALVLLTGAALMLKSLWVVRTQIGALAPAAVVSSRIESHDPQRLQSPADRLRFTDALLARIEALPGITAAAFWNVPFTFVIHVEGTPLPPPGSEAIALWVAVTPHFDRAAGLRLVAGRWLDERDSDAANVVVSETFVKRLPPSMQRLDTLVGRHVQNGPQNPRRTPWTIVGVASDFRTGIGEGTPVDDDRAYAQVFYPNAATPAAGGDLLVRTTPAATTTAAADLRRIVATGPGVSLLEARTLEDQLLSAIAPRRLQTLVLASFAALALVLALVGMAGVLSHSVAERTREIGVRVALGAARPQILALVLWRAGRLVAAGVVAGLAGSLALARVLATTLYRVEPTDPAIHAWVCLLFVVVAAITAAIPARRALHVSPVEAMRDA